MHAGESVTNVFAAAGSTAAFQLEGGYYQIAGHAGTWNSGNAALDQLMPDATTWVASALKITADGVAFGYLPPGQYRLTLTTTAAATVAVTRVPLE